MPRFRVPRMQTNAAWVSPAISFSLGTPPQPVDITGWMLAGVACSPTASVLLDAASGRLALAGDGKLVIHLDEADTAALGSGRVDVELMRVAPAPRRPLLRFTIVNHRGLV